jgi:hypothetical protein
VGFEAGDSNRSSPAGFIEFLAGLIE